MEAIYVAVIGLCLGVSVLILEYRRRKKLGQSDIEAIEGAVKDTLEKKDEIEEKAKDLADEIDDVVEEIEDIIPPGKDNAK